MLANLHSQDTMANDNCPLPEVAEALRPYIKHRDEVADIRRNLQSHLQNQINRDGAPISTINVASPGATKLGSPPTSITGVRRAYWKALDAHLTAQTKYDALRTELDQLRRPVTATNGDLGVTRAGHDDYLALLREREKHRKLKVIDKALSNVTASNGSASAGSLDDMVRSQVGELPVPPNTQPSFSRGPEVEAKIMQLKKAVVSTKRRADEQTRQAAEHTVRDVDQVAPEAEVAGLQKALQELTTWMETQLTIIAESDTDTQPLSESPRRNGELNGSGVDVEPIEALYDTYLETRQRLVHSVNDSERSTSEENHEPAEWPEDGTAQRHPVSASSTTKSTAVTMLPFIPALATAKSEEQSLIGQTAYVRRQLSSAEGDTARLVQRLADESHLVQPGASRGEDWAKAGTEASRVTKDSVSGRLANGQLFAGSAKEVYDAIESLPSMADGMS